VWNRLSVLGRLDSSSIYSLLWGRAILDLFSGFFVCVLSCKALLTLSRKRNLALVGDFCRLLVYYSRLCSCRLLRASLVCIFVDLCFNADAYVLPAVFVRIFYYAPDAFAFDGYRVLCGSWSVDYFSCAFVALAFGTVTLQWINVVIKISGTRKNFALVRKLMAVLKVFVVVSSIVMFLNAIISSTLSCICDGNNCPYQAPDYLFFISWMVLNGLAIIFCLLVSDLFVNNS
jgi:hypothetical protein